MRSADGFKEVVIARPVRLLQMPLLRCSSDEFLESGGHLDGHPCDVISESTLTANLEGLLHHTPVAVLAGEIDRSGDERSTGSQRKHGRPGWDCGHLAEHLEFDAVTGDVTIGEQADHMVLRKCLQDLGRC